MMVNNQLGACDRFWVNAFHLCFEFGRVLALGHSLANTDVVIRSTWVNGRGTTKPQGFFSEFFRIDFSIRTANTQLFIDKMDLLKWDEQRVVSPLPNPSVASYSKQGEKTVAQVFRIDKPINA